MNSLEDLMTDRVTLVKKDGTVFRENIRASITNGKIQTFESQLPIQVGDHFLRTIPSGIIEKYWVLRPLYQNGLMDVIKPHWVVEVRLDGEEINSPSTIYTGDHSRIYINSSDASSNFNFSGSQSDLLNFIAQIKASLPNLPDNQRDNVKGVIVDLEKEASSPNPSNSKIYSALLSLKTICEGTAGNLIASGIVGMVNQMIIGNAIPL